MVTGSGATQTTSTFTYGADGLRRKMLVQIGNNPASAQFTETLYILDGSNVVQEKVAQWVGTRPVVPTYVTVNYLSVLLGKIA